MEKIRRSVIAGSWYPGDPEILRRNIMTYIRKASVPDIKGRLVALIAPHAGYMYSGQVAAYAYKLLENHKFDRVVVISPSHQAYFQGASVYTLGGYETPLGIIPLDRELIDQLLSVCPVVRDLPDPHAREHSLEIQLPFLQVMLGKDFLLTPIMIGTQSYDLCAQLARGLAEVCRDKKVLLVASSDLSHYHSDREARILDGAVINRIESLDPEGLYRDLKDGRAEACGGGPMITVMLASKALGATKSRVLHYATSGDVTGDRSAVVGYLSAAFYDNPGSGRIKVGVDLGLSDEEKRVLKELARETIEARAFGKALPVINNPSEKLKEPRGAFVTIHKDGKLRGCIGMIESYRPVWETVRDMAIQAAYHDPRFPPVQPQEVKDLDIEISVLTPLKPISSPEEIEVGLHGLVVRRGPYSGLLLPQVAVEHNWDRETFLEWTCRKAGLEPDAWKDPLTKIFVFSADVF
ncbi:AmmeMemoRadiSam system protein B [Thermodesulforhabdus norvegica]|uniref:MEMO1 family protein SAMN05660836_01828 n=1 Tax=Thermodesulforhabdus norvegica TaxID=39841 RepID=A0A1I4UJ95_9BACT|nr:AmmeMemoRadiSam system protein B [Thermodesulforhabdus norvegica]SFM88971.1 hypothetical protein SAMN05660836_01828 [Thermodesulforhabdus norvegica]